MFISTLFFSYIYFCFSCFIDCFYLEFNVFSGSSQQSEVTPEIISSEDHEVPETPVTVSHSSNMSVTSKDQMLTKDEFCLSSDECKEWTEEYFPQKKVHNYFVCHNLCSSISFQETERLKPKTFLHEWIKKNTWWLCFTEGEGMYCLICKKHDTKNLQNKSEKFTECASDRYKLDAVNTHMKSDRHNAAIQAELISRVSYFHKEFVEKQEVGEDVLKKAFSTAYFLMKEIVPNRKCIPLIKFMTDIIGVKELRHFEYRSQVSLREIFLTIGKTMKEIILTKAQKATYFGIMTDEMTDVSVMSQLVTFIQYFDENTGTIETIFVSVQNVLSQHESANSEALYQLIVKELNDDDLEMSKLIGFVSDGAAVVVGCRGGVATKLRTQNPLMINIHCICHRLSLACTSTNESIKYIKLIDN